MGKYINKGNDGFASIRNSNFVDKSMLIAQVNSVLMTDSRFLCVTRARRFGKSVAVKMLNAYYDRSCDSRELFAGLQICEDNDFGKHLNRYPVLYLDMTDFVTKYAGDPRLLDKMKRDIRDELLSLYEGIPTKEDDDLMDLLVNIVDRTGEKFICLIDEWDALCREGQTQLMDEYVDLLRRLFKGSKTEYVFACAYLTGILPIKRYNTQSALNNFEEYTMLSPAQLAPYFGFTEEEVASLCTGTGIDVREMKRWYDGYEIGGEKAIYNPYAVMRAIKRGSFESYWASTNTFESLRQYITMNFDGLKDDVVSLLSDVPVKVNSLRFSNDMHRVECKDDVLTLLCHLGYLSYNSITKCASIPNYEVRQEFEAAVADTGWAEVMTALQQSEHLLECVLEGEADEVAALVGQVHQQNTSVLRYNNENALACVLSLAFYTARNRYQMVRELPSGKGFADIVLIPHPGIRKPALVLELKWDKSAQSAINQIKEKNYTSSLADYAGEIILVGINYSKKTKRHECRIERCKVGTINHPQTTHKLPETTHKPLTNGQSAVIHLLPDGEKGIRELMGAAGYKDKRSFRLSVLNDLITNGLVVMTHPENPNHRNQRYRLTLAGRKEIE